MRSDNTAFVDLLFNLLLGFCFLYFISFLLIQPIIKKAEVKTQAEYIITVTWPLNNSDDVDTWLEDPLGNVVFYRNKERGLMHLDRDDRGHANDNITLMDGTIITFPYNQEILTIRGFIPGEWVLNVHMYRKNEKSPTVAHVVVDKLNPRLETIISSDILLVDNFQEETVARFEMAAGGDILSIDKDMPKKLVKVGRN